MSTTSAPVRSADADPIDRLVPPPRPKSIRLLAAIAIVALVGVFGYMWQFGVIRPAPDCCGSSGSSTVLGRSNEADAVTIVVTFHNSSSRAIDVNGARAELPDATVVDIAPYPDEPGYSVPPARLDQFPMTVAPNGELIMALTFSPDGCDSPPPGDGWGLVQLDLAVAGDRWFPTLGRTFDITAFDPGSGGLTVLPPAGFDDVNFDTGNPVAVACTLLGR